MSKAEFSKRIFNEEQKNSLPLKLGRNPCGLAYRVLCASQMLSHKTRGGFKKNIYSLAFLRNSDTMETWLSKNRFHAQRCGAMP